MVFNEHVKIREEKFGAVVFETLKEKVFVTNETGKEILSLLQKGKTAEEVADILGCACGLEAQAIKGDIACFVAQLKEKGIVK